MTSPKKLVLEPLEELAAIPGASCMIRGEAHFDLVLPTGTEVRFGRGRFHELRALIEPPAVVVTTAGMLDRLGLDWVEPGGRGVLYAVDPHPSEQTIDAGASIAIAARAQTVVGLGGGSALDAAKSIALVADNGNDLATLRRKIAHGGTIRRSRRLVLAPTTSGSGSDVTQWASIWPLGGRKWSVAHDAARADVALIDAALTETLGPRLTAATALDAFAHAIEAIWGLGANAVSDELATGALRFARKALPELVDEPTAERRDAMALASLLAGLAVSVTASGPAHALSYALTSEYGIEHGLATGLMCRALVRAHETTCPQRIELLAGALDTDGVKGIEVLIDDLFRRAGLVASLGAFGIPQPAVPHIVEEARQFNRFGNSRVTDPELLQDALLAIS